MQETQQTHPVEITDLFKNLESTVSMCHSKSKSEETTYSNLKNEEIEKEEKTKCH